MRAWVQRPEVAESHLSCHREMDLSLAGCLASRLVWSTVVLTVSSTSTASLTSSCTGTRPAMTSAASSEIVRKAQDILVAHSLCVRATPLDRQLGRLDELPAAYKNGLCFMCRELESGK